MGYCYRCFHPLAKNAEICLKGGPLAYKKYLEFCPLKKGLAFHVIFCVIGQCLLGLNWLVNEDSGFLEE